MEHLLYEPTIGGECNVCGMRLLLKVHLLIFAVSITMEEFYYVD